MFHNENVSSTGITFDYGEDAMKQAIRKAVKIWFAALLDMSRRPAEISAMNFPGQRLCNSSGSLSWEDGRKMYNYLLDIHLPMEPQLRFDRNGSLQHTELLIMNVQWKHTDPDGKMWQRVGRWMRNGLMMRDIVWPGGSSIPPTGRPARSFLRIATLQEQPYVMYKPRNKDDTCSDHAVKCRIYERDENKKRLSNTTVPRCCVGLSVDLLRVFSRELNFDFDMFEPEDGNWGALDKETGEWNGLIKTLLDREADMVVTSIKINPDRSRAVQFSVPYLETGITIVVSLREGAISPTAFLEPFDITSWILILMLCIHVVALGVYIFEWLSPIGLDRGDNAEEPYDYPSWCLILVFSVHATGASIFIFEWLSPYGLNRGKTFFPDHKFSLFRSFWLIWAMLFSAAVDTDTPKGVSSRFLANIWALFAVVFLASYTANLAAFMITKEEYYDLSGIQDWRLQNPTHTKPPFKYATITAGSTETNIRNNHPKMFAYMRPLNKATVNQGIEAVKQGEIQAFIYDATVLEYYAGKDPRCKLRTVGNWYAMTGYGIAFPHGKNPWVPKINKVIFELQQNGEMERLQKFWLAGACYAKKDKKGVSNKTLGILNFTSAFILLGGGVLLSVLLLLFEFLYFRFGRRCVRKAHKCNCCGFISLSLSKSLTVEDTVRGTMSLSRRKRCRDEICDTQIWRLRHELDLALLKIENLQNQLSIEPSPVEMEKMARAVGRDLDYSQHNGWPRRQAARDVSTDNSLLGDDSCDSRSEGGGTVRIRRSPSYTCAIGGELISSDSQKQTNRSRYHEGKVYVGVDSNADPESAL
ncbi:hypothetical protein BaRGS_00019641 [Batillaria attramentaria]|uniref:Uncharacterized protein n=1 Tax=Batillaria attramentaria TaxID=370345 RepID=A0ABD0KPQ5_9CAEN